MRFQVRALHVQLPYSRRFFGWLWNKRFWWLWWCFSVKLRPDKRRDLVDVCLMWQFNVVKALVK